MPKMAQFFFNFLIFLFSCFVHRYFMNDVCREVLRGCGYENVGVVVVVVVVACL